MNFLEQTNSFHAIYPRQIQESEESQALVLLQWVELQR